jgi:hypothetical protein
MVEVVVDIMEVVDTLTTAHGNLLVSEHPQPINTHTSTKSFFERRDDNAALLCFLKRDEKRKNNNISTALVAINNYKSYLFQVLSLAAIIHNKRYHGELELYMFIKSRQFGNIVFFLFLK